MIPRIAHFIWGGRTFPWIFTLGIKSATARGGFDRVIFHHTDDLEHVAFWRELVTHPMVECRRLDPVGILEQTGTHASRLVDLYRKLSHPARRSDILRLALLWCHGGVYLDTDTITVADLSPLLCAGVFCGEEYIILPFKVVYSRKPTARLKIEVLKKLRRLLHRLPEGYRMFRYVRGIYPRAVNTAVLGANPGHPFLRELLDRLIALPDRQAFHPYGLGPHLLQQAVQGFSCSDLVLHPPDVFYPLAPVISDHLFRKTPHPNPQRVITPTTKVVHWYSSVSGRTAIPVASPDWIRANAGNQIFSALALPLLE